MNKIYIANLVKDGSRVRIQTKTKEALLQEVKRLERKLKYKVVAYREEDINQ